MRIWIMSDLHLENEDRLPLASRFAPAAGVEHDVVVLAGDVSRSPEAGVDWIAQNLPKPAVYVAGNHEFWDGGIENRIRSGRQAAAGLGVRFLEDDVAVIDGVRFLGCTLWSDFELHSNREKAMIEAERTNLDFQVIRTSAAGGWLPFLPRDARHRHLESLAFLRSMLEIPFAGPTVVVTHHAPSRRSIHQRFEGDPLSPSYASDLDWLIERYQPALWVHGHMHDRFDYGVGSTRVICNPRGFAAERSGFRPDLVVEVPGEPAP